MKKEKYGLRFDSQMDDLQIEFWMLRKGAEWLESHGDNLFNHYRQAQSLMWPEEDHHRWSDLILKEILQNDITVLIAPKDCVSGDTPIYNPITKESPTIQWLAENNVRPTVSTLLGPIVADVPFLKGEKELFEVVCENGKSFKATGKHLVLTESGFCYVSSLSQGSRLLSYETDQMESISAPFQQARASGVFHLNKTASGFQFCCLKDYGQCGEQPRSDEASCLNVFPLQRDALRQSRALTLDHINQYIHPSKSSCLRANSHFQDQNAIVGSLSKARSVLETFSQTCDTHEQSLQSQGLTHHASIAQQFYPDFCRSYSCHNNTHQTTVVKTINRLGRGRFYDIHVPVANHYFSNGFIHHNSGKTHGMAKFGLVDYFAFPDNTLIIVSSTDLRSLEGRVWGDIKGMFIRAKERFGWLPGHVLDSRHAICTDDLDDEMVVARDMRKGLLCVPCKNSSGGQTNIAAYVGMKQRRKRYLADEFQFMTQAMFDSLANANSGDFKMVCAGNPIGQGDPLDLIGEPKGGWESMPEPEKTTAWDNQRFLRSRTVNLVGTDSPNFDPPETKYPRYPYLINKDSIERTIAGYGKDSHQYYSQCKGVRRSGLNARRVITREMCHQFNAFNDVEWQGETRTKIFALDAAYGGVGGDRCVAGHIEYGLCADGKNRILIVPPRMVPVSVKRGDSPEDQIAQWVMNYCNDNEIPPENCFYDSTGRGSLGTAFARIWSNKVNPVEFGGVPTKRPVSQDMYITDPKDRTHRHKRCEEHYRKFVTELWWSTRLLIESDQLRGMTDEVCKEGCMREWKEVAGNKIEVESKEDTKERMGRSPDYYDWFVCAVEGARRKGFMITKLASEFITRKDDWLAKQANDYGKFMKQRGILEMA